MGYLGLLACMIDYFWAMAAISSLANGTASHPKLQGTITNGQCYFLLFSHSSVTRVTVEEKSNFKCITSVKLAFLSFNLLPILVEGLCMHGLIQKYFLHNWYFLRYHDLFDVTRVTGYKNGFLRSLDSNDFSIKPVSVTKIFFAELGT